jgi:hypothetical protein
MEIPFLALSKQVLLAVFSVVFTTMMVTVWFSDINKHASMPLEGDDIHG